MERQTKILDASVIVKWFAEEEQSDKALSLREKHLRKELQIAVSEITFVEVLNALRYKKKSEEELKKANTDLRDVQIKTLKTSSTVLEKSIALALKHNLTLYDALYLALAEMNNLVLITTDTSLTTLPHVLALEKT
jgi:predicted nucleic acid-binding protein